jgi:ubiquinone/menaquinone biosynthesis C-methylase UbiE
LRVSHWESYYRGGALAACPTGPEGGYTLELREVWAEFFAGLPDGARVLDIATGNGAIALIARETAQRMGRNLEIHGADVARIDPARNVADGARLFAGITFHPGVAAESLPFEARSFCAVSGQYALEYTDVQTSLGEIMRVLKPGAMAQFVTHHADSIVLERARASLRQADLVITETKLYRKLRRFVEAERRSPVSARRFSQELAAACMTLRETGGFEADRRVLDVTLDAIPKLLDLRAKLTPAALEREIDSVENDLRDNVRRLKDLLGVALDPAAMGVFAERARQRGFTNIAYSPIKHGLDRLVGWQLRVQRPA